MKKLLIFLSFLMANSFCNAIQYEGDSCSPKGKDGGLSGFFRKNVCALRQHGTHGRKLHCIDGTCQTR